MNHSFNVELATEYGLTEAILLENLQFWILHNKANNKNFYDGSYWTYNSAKAFSELFPYLTARKIRSALKNLEGQGIIKTGNYNKSPYDRTLWYAFTEKGISIVQKCKMEKQEASNESGENVTPIPDINTDDKPSINTDINMGQSPSPKEKTEDRPKRASSRFVPPTLEEVRRYCEERKNGIDAQYFIDYYEARGWELSKGRKVKDWKACVRTWERNSTSYSKPSKKNHTSKRDEIPDYEKDAIYTENGELDLQAMASNFWGK